VYSAPIAQQVGIPRALWDNYYPSLHRKWSSYQSLTIMSSTSRENLNGDSAGNFDHETDVLPLHHRAKSAEWGLVFCLNVIFGI
jgi:hypothetical protein